LNICKFGKREQDGVGCQKRSFLMSGVYCDISEIDSTVNGLAHLPPGLARRLTYHSTKLYIVPQRTRAEGGQVAARLGHGAAPFG